MMSKDLNKKVDDIDGRVEFLVQVIKEQQADIEELSARFACIANACSWKSEKEEDIFYTPEKNQVPTRGYLIPPGLIPSLGRFLRPCNLS